MGRGGKGWDAAGGVEAGPRVGSPRRRHPHPTHAHCPLSFSGTNRSNGDGGVSMVLHWLIWLRNFAVTAVACADTWSMVTGGGW